ncbi:MAG: flp pilus-assembly TadE/G-like family protein [Actinobacteria bacterium]|nr:flp pilus-assembly TadE/G-like family protein [Actinomycetota bacterium]
MNHPRWRDDRGVGTVLGLALGFVLIAAGLVIASLASVAVAHQRAAVAADLAAIAAAARGCEAAERVARAQGAVAVTCRIEASDAVVTVAIPAPEILARWASWAGREAPVIPSSSRAGAPD